MKKKTSLLFIIRNIKLLVGIVNLSLTAKYFGVSIDKDIWLLAISVVVFLDMAIWGPVNETFRSKFVFLRAEVGEDEAIKKTKSLLFYTFIISIIIVFFVSFFPEILGKIIAPTFTGIQFDKLIKMIAIAAPILLITQISAIETSILNAYESFFIPEITGFITAVINLMILVLLAPYIGIYSLVISYYVGSILLVLLLSRQIYILKIPLFNNYKNINFKDFKIFLIFALPFFFPYFLGQVSTILEKTLVSSLGIGYVSVLDYSRKFTDILISVLTSVLSTMLVPILSLKFIEKKPREFSNEFMQIYQLGMLFIAFIISIFTSSSSSIISVFFDKGKINTVMLNDISQLTIYYSWSTFAVFIYCIFGMALLSSKSSKKYAFWGVFAQIVSISINLIFVKSTGIYIFPMSLFIAHIIAGFIMLYHFPYKSKALLKRISKYILILILNTILIVLITRYFLFNISPFFQIICNSIIGAVTLLFFIYFFNLEEKKTINYYYLKLFNKCRNF